MYRMNRQMRIEDFVFPYGQSDKNNEWVKLADLVPWDEAEEAYAKQFVNNGHPAHPARIALGALIIKQRLIIVLCCGVQPNRDMNHTERNRPSMGYCHVNTPQFCFQ